MRKIYIASSWKNARMVKILVGIFRSEGHKVFAFCDSDERPDGLSSFVFDAAEFKKVEKVDFDWVSFLELEPAKKAFTSDKAGLDWADTVVLFLPSGRLSHLEAGYAVGRGKDLFILGDLGENEFDVMYGFAKECFRAKELAWLLDALREVVV